MVNLKNLKLLSLSSGNNEIIKKNTKKTMPKLLLEDSLILLLFMRLD